jgi:hypothetical protein
MDVRNLKTSQNVPEIVREGASDSRSLCNLASKAISESRNEGCGGGINLEGIESMRERSQTGEKAQRKRASATRHRPALSSVKMMDITETASIGTPSSTARMKICREYSLVTSLRA